MDAVHRTIPSSNNEGLSPQIGLIMGTPSREFTPEGFPIFIQIRFWRTAPEVIEINPRYIESPMDASA